ncbi:MAG TPA: efflux RND transporter periplasmic adaptor subunit [Minicystis sp.]|nr:efflux RND transporter periplasmic adaptor subunit [Minicystis sp.]
MDTLRSPRLRKILVPVLVALGITGAGFGAHKALAAKKPVVSYDTAAVEQGAVAAKVTATGTLSALVTVQVGSQVSGRVKELDADFNSPVKKGQVLAVIDPELFQASLEQQRANAVAASGSLAKAKAQVENTKAAYDRAELLANQGLVSQADVETAKTAYQSALADVQAASGQVAQANASLHQASINLQYTKIVSPVDGTVISRNVDVGQTVAAALQAPTLFTIAQDLKKMQVDTSVSESDVGKLQPGMKATFTVDAFPGETFQGEVREIRNAATTVQNVVTYDAVIDVENADLKLRPGMTANVTFTYAEADDAVLVPNAALRYHPADAAAAPARRAKTADAAKPDEKVVYVLRGGTAVPVTVHTGITDGSATQLVDAELQPGDRVVVDASGAAAQSKRPAGGGNAMRGMGRLL